MKKACCENLTSALDESSAPFEYDPTERVYGINVLNGKNGSRGHSVIPIKYCPWCGKQLPKALTNEHHDILIDLFDDYDGSDDPRTPEEFKTDEWWISRGL